MARRPKQEADGGGGGNGIGHNQKIELSASEKRSLFMGHFRKIQAQQAKLKIEQDEMKRLRSLAKTDQIPLADIDFALRCAKVDDAAIIPAEITRRIEIASFFALPVGVQVEMDFAREKDTERAKREGAAAYLAGGPREPTQYAPDSRAGQAFIKAWDAAEAADQADYASAIQKTSAMRDMTADAETAAENMPPD